MHIYKLNNLEVTEMSWKEYERKKKAKLMKPLIEQFEELKKQFKQLRYGPERKVETSIRSRSGKRRAKRKPIYT